MPSYEEVTQRAGSLRSMTGLTEAEFMGLLPHFEQALVVSMQDRTIDGQPRTSRRYTTYATCPLPTTADKLLFILTYLNRILSKRCKDSSLACPNRMRTSGFICCIRC